MCVLRVAPPLSLCAGEGRGPELQLLNVAARRTLWARDTSGGQGCLCTHSVGPGIALFKMPDGSNVQPSLRTGDPTGFGVYEGVYA